MKVQSDLLNISLRLLCVIGICIIMNVIAIGYDNEGSLIMTEDSFAIRRLCQVSVFAPHHINAITNPNPVCNPYPNPN